MRSAGSAGGLLAIVSIGYEANRQWLKIGFPTGRAGNATDQFCCPSLIWSDSPQVADAPPPSGGQPLVLPGDSWHFWFRWGYPSSDINRWLSYDSGVPCNYEDFPVPAEMTVVTEARPQSCFLGWDPYPVPVYADGTVSGAYIQAPPVLDAGPWPPPGGQWDAQTNGTGYVEESFEKDRDDLETELRDHAEDYPLLLAWLDYMLSGGANLSDPLGVGQDTPDIEFPRFVEKWEEHADEFSPEYLDPVEYWRDAADIVRRGRAGSGYPVQRCVRERDLAEVFWDWEKSAIVIVKRDGTIETYFVPDEGYVYWQRECPNG